MKKTLLILLIAFILLMPILAEPTSLDTEITTVYMGPSGFGLGLAPTGTNFLYYKSFEMIPALHNDAYFSSRVTFASPNDEWFGGYNYKTGTPKWFNKYIDIKNDEDYALSGYYFMPEASLDLYLEQGFGTNPVEGEGPLINLGIGLTTNYNRVLESLDVNKGESEPLFFNPDTGDYNAPFGPGSLIPAYPWLQDNRNTLVNYMGLYMNLDLTKRIGFRSNDGMRIAATLEYGPSWLGNSISMAHPTADFFLFNTSMSQYLTLYVKKQDNGRNWLSIQFSHSNSYTYTGGNIVPMYKIPYDRLNQSFSDDISLKFNGPQFIASDCYTDISLSLTNTCNFGYIVNEPARTTHAVEWRGKLGVKFHMRLFGFMHFSYNLGYSIYSGIHTSYPGFSQDAKVYFYIAL